MIGIIKVTYIIRFAINDLLFCNRIESIFFPIKFLVYASPVYKTHWKKSKQIQTRPNTSPRDYWCQDYLGFALLGSSNIKSLFVPLTILQNVGSKLSGGLQTRQTTSQRHTRPFFLTFFGLLDLAFALYESANESERALDCLARVSTGLWFRNVTSTVEGPPC